jgi:protoporphyrinogen oxidase
MSNDKYILGAGMTGLAAGYVTGFTMLEAKSSPGGICSSYYIRPFDKERLESEPVDNEAYRFEIGGGHWIFGGDERTINFIREFSPVKKYYRVSSVYFHQDNLYVPYPIQNNLRFLPPGIIKKALEEISRNNGTIPHTMKQWLQKNFGLTLCELFFSPFNSLYTAGLFDRIAPQDAYKSPVDINLVIKGAEDQPTSVGYNSSFLYPEEGLDVLAKRIAARCQIQYNKNIIAVDVKKRELLFDNHESISYDKIISTLPLNQALHLCGLSVCQDEDPYTSVLVLNIGAKRGDRCPDDHWLYNLKTDSGFHRVGFYSNVDRSFIPISSRSKGDRVSIYVERAYERGRIPSQEKIKKYFQDVVKELQDWAFIKEVEVIDNNWIDVAYTWSWPDSEWKDEAIDELKRYGIFQVGRYGRWTFQGIADSIRDGLIIGSEMKRNT